MSGARPGKFFERFGRAKHILPTWTPKLEPGPVSRNDRHNRRFNRCLERVETITGPCLRPDQAGPASTIRTSTVRAGVWLFMLALVSPSHLAVTGGSINDVVMALPWLATILIAVTATRRVSDETTKRAAARILTAAVRHPRLYAVPAAAAALVSEGTSMSVSKLVDARRRLVRAVLILGGGGLVALQTATTVNSVAGRVAETATTAVLSSVVGWVVLMPAVVVSVPGGDVPTPREAQRRPSHPLRTPRLTQTQTGLSQRTIDRREKAGLSAQTVRVGDRARRAP